MGKMHVQKYWGSGHWRWRVIEIVKGIVKLKVDDVSEDEAERVCCGSRRRVLAVAVNSPYSTPQKKWR